jgi:hypothetical protein
MHYRMSLITSWSFTTPNGGIRLSGKSALESSRKRYSHRSVSTILAAAQHDGPATVLLVRPICHKPLVTKCWVESTGVFMVNTIEVHYVRQRVF